jgi:hypothetical protein
MSDRNPYPRAGVPSGQWDEAESLTARDDQADSPDPLGSGRYESLTDELTVELDRDQPADDVSTVTAEWALWGKEADDSEYSVLRCSTGTFKIDDFREIITRYASGAKGQLPQYTVCWIPSANGHDGYLAVGIHELADADPRLSGGRSRTARGRVTEYVRLFCARYEEVAGYRATYAGLVDGVRRYQLGPESSATIEVPLPAELPPHGLVAADWDLAEQVATLLLTTRPVCVLDAHAVSAEVRLRFIDLVMSLLPYGLRATMSASTWASSTVQDLKLRLFFSNARRDDDDRTTYVVWQQPSQLNLASLPEAAQLYQRWWRRVDSGARGALRGETKPVRFAAAELHQMAVALPRNRSLAEIMEDLADGLRRNDRIVITDAVDRLNGHHRGVSPPADDREANRALIARHKLLRDHRDVSASTRGNVYRALLPLALQAPLTYAGYCWIEECVGGPPHRTLQTEMIRLHSNSYLSWILTCKAGAGIDDDVLIRMLYKLRFPPDDPLNQLEQAKETVRPEHWAIAYDFAVRYLRASAPNPEAELIRHSYFAELLRFAFPRDRNAQETRLDDTIKFVFGPKLSRIQVIELFSDIGSHSTPAIEAVVARRAAVRNSRKFVAEQANLARTGDRGYRGGVGARWYTAQRPYRSQYRQPGPTRLYTVVVALALFFFLIVVLAALHAV